MLLATGVILVSVADRRDRRAAAPLGGDFGACAKLEGDAARQCYRREVGRELQAVGGAVQQVTFAAPADTGEVTLTSLEGTEPLLCDLHARVGVVDAQIPSWLGWTEPLVESPPRS
ncbi:MAG TPA: hypothetical protein VFZ00_27525 [Solirubrobacter sp.]|nr:hypothetical protein [Solirubrobacter sp.]